MLLPFTFREDRAGGHFTTTGAEYLPLYQTYEFPIEVLDASLRTTQRAARGRRQSRLETARPVTPRSSPPEEPSTG